MGQQNDDQIFNTMLTRVMLWPDPSAALYQRILAVPEQAGFQAAAIPPAFQLRARMQTASWRAAALALTVAAGFYAGILANRPAGYDDAPMYNNSAGLLLTQLITGRSQK